MTRIKETIKIKIENKTINVYHDGIKPYKDWTKDSKDVLQDWVQETLNKGETEGWLPFANFEASVSFKNTYPFNEGDDYWTIEGGVIVHSYWDEESEEMYDENPNTEYFSSREKAHEFLTKNK